MLERTRGAIVLRVTFWLRSIGIYSTGPLCYVKRPKGKRALVNALSSSLLRSLFLLSFPFYYCGWQRAGDLCAD